MACTGRLLDERVARRDELAEAVAATEVRIAAAARAAGRERSELTLVAVSKTWPASDVLLLASLGLHDFGENRVQEVVRKAADVAAGMAAGGVRWHFVGRLQRNKCRTVAGFATLVHSVDRPELVTALAGGAVVVGRQLDVLLQVSLDTDPSRGGALPRDIPGLAGAVTASPSLRLRGVMAVAPLGAPDAGVRRAAVELLGAPVVCARAGTWGRQFCRKRESRQLRGCPISAVAQMGWGP